MSDEQPTARTRLLPFSLIEVTRYRGDTVLVVWRDELRKVRETEIIHAHLLKFCAEYEAAGKNLLGTGER